MKTRKAIHLLAEIKFSGAEVMLNLASEYFQQNNIDLHALSVGKELGNYSGVLRSCGYTIHHFPNSLSLGHFRSIHKFFKENKFDVVHMHFEGAFFWYATVIWLADPSAKIIRTVHNVFPYSGYIRFRRSLQRFICRNIYNIEFVSIGSSVAEVEKKKLGNRTTYVPNWIDIKKFYPLKDEWEKLDARQQLGIPQEWIVLLSVGASTEIKNQKDIIIALKSILSKVANVFYVHVGDGALQGELKELARKLGVDSNISFAGQMKDVRQALIASDIYVMPSQFEGLSISLLEAMAVGLPSVVYNSYGLKDLITNEENGFIVEKNNEALAIAILRLIESPDLRVRYGNNARNYILDNYDMKKSLDKLIHLYFPDSIKKSTVISV